ncbi:MAG: ABC transporter ATP-binding protein [Acidobacteriaceae bacterium]|nr:ABC transporter ATP-binding protein [Acidobacteriaceae bacterium]
MFSIRSFLLPHWRRLALVVAVSLVSTAVSLYQPYLSKVLVDKALLGRNLNALIQVTAVFVGIAALSFVLNIASGMWYTRLSAEILFDMRLLLYRHLQRLSPRFYARTRMGDIVSRINNDIAEIQRISAETALATIGNVLSLIGAVALLLWLDWRLFVFSVLLVPLSLWLLRAFRARLEAKVAVVRQVAANIGSFLIETLQGMKLVVASNAQEREVERFRTRNRSFIAALLSMQKLTYLSGGLPGLVLSLSASLVFVYGGYQVIEGRITMGTLVAFVAYQMRLMPPLQALMGTYANLAIMRVSLGRVRELMDTPVEICEPDHAIALPSVRGEIAFRDVTFTFDRGGPVLSRVSFNLQPGEVVAIVGPSGSGKSTIADLLLRLLDPDAGSILLDGHDLRTIRLNDLRRNVVLVDQEPYVFHASIAENLRYIAPDASDEDLRVAAQTAGIASFIDNLPQGYETIVGERGTALSLGERQRLALARAYLANPAVLILDEPTASLDPATEQAVIDGYHSLMKGRTTLVITHRFEPARRADRIITLESACETAANRNH